MCAARIPSASALAPPAPQRIAPPCSSASQLLWRSSTSRARASSATTPRLDADRSAHGLWLTRDLPGSDAPCARDVALDPGGDGNAAHDGVLMCVRIKTVSAPASGHFVALPPRTVYASCSARRRSRNTRFRRLAKPHLDRTCTGGSRQHWRLRPFDHRVGDCESSVEGTSRPSARLSAN